MSKALSVVRGLKHGDFHKSMTTHINVKVWQDVYHAQWSGKQCSMCFTGVLRDGVRKQTVNYRGP